MEFRNRKLPKAKAAELTLFPIDTAEPYRPLPAPVYLLLPRNEKLVSVKGPFDFFSASDLIRLKGGGTFFYGPIFRDVKPFHAIALEVKKVLNWNAAGSSGVLEPSPYEISDALLRKLARLWAPLPGSAAIGIESYFVLTFVNEICEPILGKHLTPLRESDPEKLELLFLRSGLFVFFALHLGHLDLGILSAYRNQYFSDDGSHPPLSAELADLRRWTDALVPSPEIRVISSDDFGVVGTRVGRKIGARLARVRRELLDPNAALRRAEDEGEVDHNG